MKLNWVTFKVSDLEKSLHFYTEVLELEISVKFGDENHQIVMLGQENEAKVELVYEAHSTVEKPGNGISIGLETDNIDELIDKLKDKGYQVTGPISPNPRIRFFFVQDPDGYTIQLIKQN